MTAAISITDLKKIYTTSAKVAINGLSLQVNQGVVLGLLGCNGAGKSTLINIIANTVKKTSGKIEIMGFDVDQHPKTARRAIGVVPQEIAVDNFLSLNKTLRFTAGYYGLKVDDAYIEKILDSVSLLEQQHLTARSLSGGMKRRFLMAKAMVHDPAVLILDEPTAGVDLNLRHKIWAHIRKLKEAGKTVVITTHNLEEVEELCDEIAFLRMGQIVKQDKTEQILKHSQARYLEVEFESNLTIPDLLKTLQLWETVSSNKMRVEITDNQTLMSILQAASTCSVPIKNIRTDRTSLVDVFNQVLMNN
ncbi:ABC transporter ATP-binding protein [Rickettsiales endosymbiont of Paramecium tredecaurelia]|uniref:ABC transporter ATP-binding protein n=1 Tax=Candidatus Sarmatiella mevalonica TaxID=2770581 RepID=UPI0019219807|nr:ABC transporter ATP-binding protein [Candidatus Sarmatiella mevalonica]MBL3284942.1 ABC transporter ATP-binding protein [Candidatus Sarmatiella mevalonica]